METQEQRVQRVLRDAVVISPYDPAWPALFREEKEHLLSCLPADLVRRIEHFGSTAVPGLAAKPVVDMLVEVTDLQASRVRIAPVLESQGYDYFWRPTRGDDGPPFYAWFIRRDRSSGARTHHVHMVEAGFAEHWDRLLFRDYLIDHPGVARGYEAVKTRLTSDFPGDRAAYTRGKSDFIVRVTEEAKRYYAHGRRDEDREADGMTDVEVKPSRIEGLGIFASRAFRAGDRITQVHVVREITPESPIRPDLGERQDHCSYPDGKIILVAFPERHVNHSCDPNAWELYEGTTSVLAARRDIAVGDEVTIDYNVNIANGTAWPCRCGAARCRGEVAGDFFLLPVEWQREYRPLLAEWFVRRHRERLAPLVSGCD